MQVQRAHQWPHTKRVGLTFNPTIKQITKQWTCRILFLSLDEILNDTSLFSFSISIIFPLITPMKTSMAKGRSSYVCNPSLQGNRTVSTTNCLFRSSILLSGEITCSHRRLDTTLHFLRSFGGLFRSFCILPNFRQIHYNIPSFCYTNNKRF